MSDPLVVAASAVRANAYAPYSRFAVGAAIETEDGRIFAGTNVENASYGLASCAERVAVGAAISAGARRFKRIVVVTDAVPAAPPCGACRQVLAEFGAEVVVEAIGARDTRRWVLKDLLPDRFGPETLA